MNNHIMFLEISINCIWSINFYSPQWFVIALFGEYSENLIYFLLFFFNIIHWKLSNLKLIRMLSCMSFELFISGKCD